MAWTELRQSGWVIYYRDYHEVSGRRLPTRIRMENGNYHILLRVDDWQKRVPAVTGATGAGPEMQAVS